MAEERTLRRDLGTLGAILMGLGAIVGTGVFVSTGLAAGVTGPSVVLAILLAAGVATCNGLSSAQLAADHPVSGGTYEYGYHYVHPIAGFVAGWMFVCAKSASAATAALGFASYALALVGLDQLGAVIPLALGGVIALTGIVLVGMRRTSLVNTLIVSSTLAVLVFFVLAGLPAAFQNGTAEFVPFFRGGGGLAWRNVFHATALLFVAYTGYGRIATLGEEVREPARTIPRAIIVTLIVTAVLYLAVSGVAVAVAGADAFAETARTGGAPLEAVARLYAVPGAAVVLAVGAVTAMLGVLLNLILGVSRVLLAMGRRRDLPGALATVDASGRSPWVAVLVTGAIIQLLVLIGDIRTTWTFSAFTVLVYYGLTNFAALFLPPEARRFPRSVSVLGLVACVGLAFFVPVRIWLVGLGLIVLGIGWHFLARHMRQRSVPS